MKSALQTQEQGITSCGFLLELGKLQQEQMATNPKQFQSLLLLQAQRKISFYKSLMNK